MIGFAVQNRSERKRLYRRDALARLFDRVYTGEKLSGSMELSIVFCDDDYMVELNRSYRDQNTTTDVLSFEQEAVPGAPMRILGDIVVSLETVERVCGRDPARMRREVLLLICHGLLHLLGYDHLNDAEANEMELKEIIILSQLGYPDPYREIEA